MENFDTILTISERSLNNIRGYLDKENVEEKIKELEQISLKKNFWKDKELKKLLNKKFFKSKFL